MVKKNGGTVNNMDGNTNQSSSASSTVAFPGEQINPPTFKDLSSIIFDDHDDENFYLMEMLSSQDVIGPGSSVMLPLQAPQPQPEPEIIVPAPTILGVKSEIVYSPEARDDFPMISLSSNEILAGNQVGRQIVQDGEEEKADDKHKKLLKPENKSIQKKKEPKYAFVTKSDIDIIDDGYKWRKYGQKAVKSSPFPRNYYHCTSTGCTIKKRVERSSEDPSTVVTTYVGNHNHICPANIPRGSMVTYSKSNGFPGSSIGVGGRNVSSGTGGDIGAWLNGGIGGNFSNGISGGFSNSYDGSFYCGMVGSMDGTSGGTGGASGGIVVSFGSGSEISFSNATGDGNIGGSTYGLGGGKFVSKYIGAASAGGGSLEGGVVDNIGGSGMITNNAYNAGAIRSSSIGSHAIGGGDAGGSGFCGLGGGGDASDINSPYSIEQLASYQQQWEQHQQQPYSDNSPTLSSYTFPGTNVVLAAATAAMTTSSATLGSQLSMENDEVFQLTMHKDQAMLRETAVFKDMLRPQVHQEKKRDQQ